MLNVYKFLDQTTLSFKNLEIVKDFIKENEDYSSISQLLPLKLKDHKRLVEILSDSSFKMMLNLSNNMFLIILKLQLFFEKIKSIKK